MNIGGRMGEGVLPRMGRAEERFWFWFWLLPSILFGQGLWKKVN